MAPADEPNWLDENELAGWMAVAALMVRLPAALDSQLQADAGLSFFEYMVLAVLSDQPDRSLQMSDIARLSSASLSRLSHGVTRLEQQGFVERERLPGPGRRTIARLTDAGHAKVVASAPGHVAQVRRLVIDQVGPADLAALRRVGDAVLAAIEPGGECVEGRPARPIT